MKSIKNNFIKLTTMIAGKYVYINSCPEIEETDYGTNIYIGNGNMIKVKETAEQIFKIIDEYHHKKQKEIK